MPLFRIIRMAITAVLLIGCSEESSLAPPVGFAHAAASNDCGPTDGAAVTIYLSAAPVESLNPPTPYVRLAIWRPLDSLGDRWWSVAGDGGEGAASYHSTATSYERASLGAVRVTGVSADSILEGTVDVRFPDAGRIRGGFRAPWIHRNLLCG